MPLKHYKNSVISRHTQLFIGLTSVSDISNRFNNKHESTKQKPSNTTEIRLSPALKIQIILRQVHMIRNQTTGSISRVY